MDNFVCHHPVKILFGRGMLDQLGKEVAALGSHALVVYGKQSLKKNGLHQQIIEHLENGGITYTELGDVPPNPLLSDCKRGIEAARRGAVDVIVAIGGGSVIDIAKSIAAGTKVQHDVWKFFTGKKTIRSALPVLTVPTVAGSGSEVNHAMVLTHDTRGQKFGFAHRFLYPQTCIADPELTVTVPAHQTVSGAIDTLCHCLEPYMTTQSAGIEMQLGLLEQVCASVVASVPAAIQYPEAYPHRAALLWSAMLAMTPTATAGLGRVYHTLHLLEHGLSARQNIAHGIGLAALLPGWLRYHRDEWEDRIGRWGNRVFSIKESPLPGQADSTIIELVHFLDAIGCPASLSQLGVDRKEIDFLVDHAMAASQVRPSPGFNRNKAHEMLDCCW